MHWRLWLRRLVPYLGRRQAEADLQEELCLHLELERERQRDAGLPEADARRAARRTLGNSTLIRERTRDVWGSRRLDDLGRDVVHAVRGLRRSPGFTATVVIVLALGIGANTVMFGIVHGMLIRPLPYPEADAIMRLGESRGGEPGWNMFLSNRSMQLLREEAESFEHLAAYGSSAVEWTGPDSGVTLRGAQVSPSLFPLLRATPHLGRLFAEEESREGQDRVALLSFDTWTTRFASDPDVVGAPLGLAGESLTVVGVLSEGFSFPNRGIEVWTPYVIPPVEEGRTIPSIFTAVGRLRAGVSSEQAATEFRAILQRRDAGRAAGGTREIAIRIAPLQEAMVGEYRPALRVLTVAAVLVLAIACVNVTGLLLARGIARHRELALRGALGATRGRLIRQLLTENVVLGGAGGAIGLAAAAVLLRAVPALVPGDIARLDETSIDGVVLAFTLGLSLVVGLAFGVVPALQRSPFHSVRTLNETCAAAAGGFRFLRSSRRARRWRRRRWRSRCCCWSGPGCFFAAS